MNYLSKIGGIDEKMTVTPATAKILFSANRDAIIEAWNNEAKRGCYGEFCGVGCRDYNKWLREFMQNIMDIATSKTRCKALKAIREACDKTCQHIGNYYTYEERNARRVAYGL